MPLDATAAFARVESSGSGQSAPPPTSDGEISVDLTGKERQGKKKETGKWSKKEGEPKKEKGKVEN